MPDKTPLYDAHVALGARMVDFGGWEMPVNYGSQIEEHHAVRNDAGMFDVSHMTVVDLKGAATRSFLSRLLANDVAKLREPGKALYSCMLNDAGGVIDDLIVYYLADDWFRMVVNAATREKDLAWIKEQAAGEELTITERSDLAMIAVQGPNARQKAAALLSSEQAESALALKPFSAAVVGELFVARTGYTGEDGWEILLPAELAADFWNRLNQAGVRPCGLGARDTLRLEAGMNLYGNDMDESTTPLESALSWTVALEPQERDFIGRSALDKIKADGVDRKLVGLILEGKGVLRAHQKVICAAGDGETTSGSFSPTLGCSIGMARVPVACAEQCEVEIRGKLLPARVVKTTFVRNGEAVV